MGGGLIRRRGEYGLKLGSKGGGGGVFFLFPPFSFMSSLKGIPSKFLLWLTTELLQIVIHNEEVINGSHRDNRPIQI